MHTDEDGSNLPISLACPKLLVYTGGRKTTSVSNFKMSYNIFVTHMQPLEAILGEAFEQNRT